jgi:hypothetical protein
MTGEIIIRLPGDKDRGKASRLATRLAEVLDPAAVRVAAPNKTAELRVAGIDISVVKEELRQALASAAGCGSAKVQVGEIRRMRRKVLSPPGAGPWGHQCPLDAVGELRDEHQRKMADRLGCGTRTPAGEQEYGEHLRGEEGVFRGRRDVGHLGAVPEDPRLESGRGSRDTLSDHLYIFMVVVPEGRGQDQQPRRPRWSESLRPVTTTQMAPEGAGQGDVAGGSHRLSVEMGRPRDDQSGKRRRGGGDAIAALTGRRWRSRNCGRAACGHAEDS